MSRPFPQPFAFDPNLDLQLERVVPVPPALVWEAWTTPELLMQWFCPAPWTVSACELDLRPGGAFDTTMRSPEGEEHPNKGCYLEVVPGERLVFTDALHAGFRPGGGGFMTGIIEIFAEGEGTRYRATALHSDAETRAKHEEMGFHAGWGAALDQLVALMQAR